MTKYYYVESIVPTELIAEVEAIAYKKFACSGIEDFSIEEARVDEILGERSYSGGDVPHSVIADVEFTLAQDKIAKKYHFSTLEQAKNFHITLEKQFKVQSELQEADVKDWNEEWKKSYTPIYVGPQLEVVPEWFKGYKSEASNKLFIHPGMGFGTGSHETTFLCLKLYLEASASMAKKERCLDFGCGSGILGIAFSLVEGSDRHVDYYDIDQHALNNTVQNFELNNLCSENYGLFLPPQRENITGQYNIVFANILQNILLLEANNLAQSLETGGCLILSGLLLGQDVEVIKELIKENGRLRHIKSVTKGDWCAVLMELS